MPSATADVVIGGAGIAGISAAYFLSMKHGIKNVVLVDPRSPMSLTSDKSTECYRNWWPGPGDAMVGLMNRSIDLLEGWAAATGNMFNLNRRGYVYATADPARVEVFRQNCAECSALGAGSVRMHGASQTSEVYTPHHAEGYASPLTGADLILDQSLIRKHFPYLNEQTLAVLHARRCGWFSAQTLGMYLLEQAKAHGARVIPAGVEAVETEGGRVAAVRLNNGETLETPIFINAAGPFLDKVGRMLGVELPVFSELHTKMVFNDGLGVIPRDAPFVIWADPQVVPWSDEERAYWAESDETRWMTEPFPAGAHFRPEGAGSSVLMLWDYHNARVEPVAEPKLPDDFPDVVIRGLSTMTPGLRQYFERMPRVALDGGYYTKTRENRPLIGPLPVEGAYVIGAFSGFGVMVAPGAGELLAAHVAGAALPRYEAAFRLARYEDAEYQRLLESWGSTGQL